MEAEANGSSVPAEVSGELLVRLRPLKESLLGEGLLLWLSSIVTLAHTAAISLLQAVALGMRAVAGCTGGLDAMVTVVVVVVEVTKLITLRTLSISYFIFHIYHI